MLTWLLVLRLAVLAAHQASAPPEPPSTRRESRWWILADLLDHLPHIAYGIERLGEQGTQQKLRCIGRTAPVRPNRVETGSSHPLSPLARHPVRASARSGLRQLGVGYQPSVSESTRSVKSNILLAAAKIGCWPG
jgi:hypothetical protein